VSRGDRWWYALSRGGAILGEWVNRDPVGALEERDRMPENILFREVAAHAAHGTNPQVMSRSGKTMRGRDTFTKSQSDRKVPQSPRTSELAARRVVQHRIERMSFVVLGP
jgi:hypothetical protein